MACFLESTGGLCTPCRSRLCHPARNLPYGTSDDAIYALPADGSGEPELVLENAVLLDVIPPWKTN